MTRQRSLSGLLPILLLIAGSGVAAEVRDLVPATAPRGARIVVAGRGLDVLDIALTFTDSAGKAVNASILNRSATFVETSVPRSAASGPVRVTSGGAAIATFSFVLAPDPLFTLVATLAGPPRT